MSSPNWQWLVDLCLSEKLPFFPSQSGEPWICYEAAEKVTQFSADTLARRAKDLPKHPAFKGFIRLTDFETYYGKEEE